MIIISCAVEVRAAESDEVVQVVRHAKKKKSNWNNAAFALFLAFFTSSSNFRKNVSQIYLAEVEAPSVTVIYIFGRTVPTLPEIVPRPTLPVLGVCTVE